jgi:hypothetical protein
MRKTLAAFAGSETGTNGAYLAANGGHPPTAAEPLH